MKDIKWDARTISRIALLMALDIVLTRFIAIQTPIVRISFGFLPSAMIGMLFGPLAAGVAGALADLAGTFLFGSGGLFFPGFTLSAFLGGLIYGVFLYKKPKSLLRISLAVIVITVVVNLGLNTLWVYILTEQAVVAFFPARLVQNLVLAPIRIAVIYFVANNQTLRRAMQLTD